MSRKIFITSYPYAYERYFKVFDHFKNKENLCFILPEKWKTRAGFIDPPYREDIKIIKTKAFFFGSKHPIIRGLLKGWMPATGRILRKYAKPGDALYTAIEPNLLTTYMNGRLAKKLGLKHFFFTWQNVPYRERLTGLKLKITEWLIKKNIAMSAGAICGNTKAAEILREYAPPGFKILLSPISGVDTDKFNPDAVSIFREKYKLQNKIIMLFAGVFDERKGIDTILRSFLMAVEKIPELHLVMIGTGPLKSRAEKFILDSGLARQVTFIDWLPNNELPGYFANSDIFVHPSVPRDGWEEQFGYSMAEASACGLPVIATKTGSIDEVVLDKKTGILISPEDINALSGAIVELAQDPDRRTEFGKKGREHITQNFSHNIIAEKMEKFLCSLE